MSFNRWKSIDDYTYVFRLFSKHHEYMNSLYWASVPASSFVIGTHKRELQINAKKTTHEILKISDKNIDSIRVTKSSEDYVKHLKEFDNWTRLNVLVSISAYFETYLSSVVSLAIESDLGLIYSIPKKIDGISILKHKNDNEYSFFDKSESITKGTWAQRISAYKKLFANVPQALIDFESDLEKMRNIRNNVAHAFGRGIEESRARNNRNIQSIERISIERLKKYMCIIRKVAKEIDKQLLSNHIGEYELIYFYHKEKINLKKSINAYELKKMFNALKIKNRNIEFYKELINYYDNI